MKPGTQRYCIKCDDGTDVDRCCGGRCMAMTDALEWLGTVLQDRDEAERIILTLRVGDHVELRALGRTIYLWRNY